MVHSRAAVTGFGLTTEPRRRTDPTTGLPSSQADRFWSPSEPSFDRLENEVDPFGGRTSAAKRTSGLLVVISPTRVQRFRTYDFRLRDYLTEPDEFGNPWLRYRSAEHSGCLVSATVPWRTATIRGDYPVDLLYLWKIEQPHGDTMSVMLHLTGAEVCKPSGSHLRFSSLGSSPTPYSFVSIANPTLGQILPLFNRLRSGDLGTREEEMATIPR